MSRSICGAVAILLVAVLSSGVGSAAERAPLGLSYEADAICPNGWTFAQLVNDRARSINLMLVGPTQPDVVVVLGQADGSVRGTLQIRRHDGTTYEREMSGTSCDEVGSALAFVAALALSGREEPSLPTNLRTTSPSPATRADATLLDEAEDPEPSTSPPVTSWAWGVGIGLGVRNGLAPTWANTEEIDVELRSTNDSLVAPTLRIAVVRAEPVTRIDFFGTTRFTWAAGRAGACPLRLRPIAPLELQPCIGVDVGTIGAAGTPASSLGSASDASSLWADTFVALRLQLHLIGAVYAIGEGEIVVPLTRPEFAFEPSTVVYEVPPVAGAGLAGLFVRIP